MATLINEIFFLIEKNKLIKLNYLKKIKYQTSFVNTIFSMIVCVCLCVFTESQSITSSIQKKKL